MARPCWAVVGAVLLVGACGDTTGLHVFARMGTLAYDTLELEVSRPAGDGASQVLVDPSHAGRYPGPFKGGDQDVYVYLPDNLDGAQLHCATTALLASAVVGQGAADTTVHRGDIEAVEIVLGATGAGGGAGAMAAGSGGVTASGGAGAATGGAPGFVGAANGATCNRAADCTSDHCVDGVCCESACAGACSSCALLGSAGLCRPARGGLPDPRGVCADMGAATCGTNGLCDVSGHCAKYPAGALCGAPSCKNSQMWIPAATCDGAGSCVQGQDVKCSGGCAVGVCL